MYRVGLDGAGRCRVQGDVFTNEIYYCLQNFTMFNYADDNSLSHEHDNFDTSKEEIENDGENVTDWFQDNGMKANPDKYQGIIFGKQNQDTSLHIKDITIECQCSVKLVGVHIDSMLKFDEHVDAISVKASKQINAVMRLCNVLPTEIKFTMYKSFICANFNYCPVVWMNCGKVNARKLERLQCRALRFVLNDFTSYYEQLLEKSGETQLIITRIRALAIEVYKCVTGIAPSHMCEMYNRQNKKYDLRDNNKLIQNKCRTTHNGLKSFSYSVIQGHSCGIYSQYTSRKVNR